MTLSAGHTRGTKGGDAHDARTGASERANRKSGTGGHSRKNVTLSARHDPHGGGSARTRERARANKANRVDACLKIETLSAGALGWPCAGRRARTRANKANHMRRAASLRRCGPFFMPVGHAPTASRPPAHAALPLPLVLLVGGAPCGTILCHEPEKLTLSAPHDARMMVPVRTRANETTSRGFRQSGKSRRPDVATGMGIRRPCWQCRRFTDAHQTSHKDGTGAICHAFDMLPTC